MEEMINWVDVDDRLPDSGLTVLVLHPACDDPVWLAYLEDGMWWDVDGWHHELNAVTHWAEIPSGPSVMLEAA